MPAFSVGRERAETDTGGVAFERLQLFVRVGRAAHPWRHQRMPASCRRATTSSPVAMSHILKELSTLPAAITAIRSSSFWRSKAMPSLACRRAKWRRRGSPLWCLRGWPSLFAPLHPRAARRIDAAHNKHLVIRRERHATDAILAASQRAEFLLGGNVLSIWRCSHCCGRRESCCHG